MLIVASKYRNQPSPVEYRQNEAIPMYGGPPAVAARRGASAPRCSTRPAPPPDPNNQFGRSQSLDNDARTRGGGHLHQAYRRHKAINLDEEQRRRAGYKREGSTDSIYSERSGGAKDHQHRSTGRSSAELRRDSVESNRTASGGGGGGAPRPPPTSKNRNYGKDDSFDSLDSERSTTVRSPPGQMMYAVGMDRIAGLSRHIRGIRLTPETCV